MSDILSASETRVSPWRRLAYALRLWGWPLPLGVLFLLLAGGIEIVGIWNAADRLHELEGKLARMEAKVPRRAYAASTAVALPPDSALTGQIASIMALAQKHGVAMESGEYRQSREGRLLRCRLVLPVRASYPQLRAWLAEILNTHAAASLDEVSMHRVTATVGMLEGRVQLSLYLEGPK
jgi:hypothetical protein